MNSSPSTSIRLVNLRPLIACPPVPWLRSRLESRLNSTMGTEWLSGSQLALQFLGLVAIEQHDGHDQDQQHHHRQGGGHRPVTVVEEFLPEHAADHQSLRAAQ